MLSYHFIVLLLSAYTAILVKAQDIDDDDHFGPNGVCNQAYPTFDLSGVYEPLEELKSILPDDDGVTRVQMSLNLAYYEGPSYNTIMRTWNRQTPGPAIHVKPGSSMELELINCLHPPLGNQEHNVFSSPNTTNMHTHGPHISGELPGDDIFAKVEPSSSMKFKYKFPSNHMPGTHWMHPHFHGSTALQVGQGVAGMLIVDEDDDYNVPDYIKNMPDKKLLFQNINVPHLRSATVVSKDDVTNYTNHNFEVTNTSTTADILMLVNMQYIPIVQLEQHKWYRLRMAMSSIDKTLGFLSENGTCELKLIAKDGILLNDAPRDITTVILSPGNRADVAIKCSEIGLHNMTTAGRDRIPLVGGYGAFDPATQPTIFVVDVVESSSDGYEMFELTPFQAPTPCYLVDLQAIDPCDVTTTFTNVFHCVNPPPPPSRWPGRQTSLDTCGVFGPAGNGGGGDPDIFFPFKNKDNFVLDFPVGTVQEITLGAASFHPYHQHVNSFQIISININQPPDQSGGTLTDDVATWYKIGDWHDTLQLPNFQDSPETSVTVRFQSDYYTGRMVQHCHMLDHEDKGMMAVYRISGQEGKMWSEAREINPTCIMPGSSKSGKSRKLQSGGKSSKDSKQSKADDMSATKSTKSSKTKTSKSSQSCNKKFSPYEALPSYGYDELEGTYDENYVDNDEEDGNLFY